MFSLTYVSSATTMLTNEQLVEMLSVCKSNNLRADITGMLLYKDGNFMQVLEGEKSEVLRTHQRISRDTRHKSLITLLQSEIETRQFPGWSMGFKSLIENRPEAGGYSEFLNTPLTAQAFGPHPEKAQVLLQSFKQSMSGAG